MRGSVAGFEWDEGNWPKCGKHRVSRAEIGHSVLPDRYPPDREARFDAVGQNADARREFVVFTLRDKAGQRLIRPISARYMHRKEIESYERQKGEEA
jgi:uncharacterized protein